MYTDRNKHGFTGKERICNILSAHNFQTPNSFQPAMKIKRQRTKLRTEKDRNFLTPYHNKLRLIKTFYQYKKIM